MSGSGRDAATVVDLFSGDQLAALQGVSLEYFYRMTNPANGLVADKTGPGSPSSIAAVGLALATIPVAAELGFLSREELARRALLRLRFFHQSPHGPEPD